MEKIQAETAEPKEEEKRPRRATIVYAGSTSKEMVEAECQTEPFEMNTDVTVLPTNDEIV